MPVLRAYIDEIKVTRPYFNTNPDSHDEAIAAELKRHAVFQAGAGDSSVKKR